WACVAHGRTRMMVCPLIRSVGLKAATASSRVRDVADVRPQPSVPHPLDDLTQLGTIGLDNEVDRQAVGGPRLGRAGNGHQCSSGSNHACGPLLDVPTDDVEHHALQENGISREDLVDEAHIPLELVDEYVTMPGSSRRVSVELQ